MALIRSIIHMLWMAITVVPYTLAIVLGSLFGMRGTSLYRIARAWLSLCVHSARPLLGIQYRVTGMEHLPQGEKNGAVLLCKHQSTYETFLMPAIMPHPLAYVFKKELLYVPFFGWAMAMLKPIAIDRSNPKAALKQLAKQGAERIEQGAWVLVFPEGTRIPPGQIGKFSRGGTALAVNAGLPVLPIAHNAGEFWPKHGWAKYPGTIQVVIGPLMYAEGEGPRAIAELNERAFNWVSQTQQQISGIPTQLSPLDEPSAV